MSDIQTFPGDRAWSVKAACERLDISRGFFYAQVKAGRLRVSKLGARTLVRQAEIERFLAELPVLDTEDVA